MGSFTIKSDILWLSIFVSLLISLPVFGSVNPNSQLVNLNLQIRANNVLKNSNIMMPFYQTAELERMIGKRNVFIELNPKRGKVSDEISLEIKFSNASGAKAFFKKEIVAKVNQHSKITYKGLTIHVRPVLN